MNKKLIPHYMLVFAVGLLPIILLEWWFVYHCALPYPWTMILGFPICIGLVFGLMYLTQRYYLWWVKNKISDEKK